MRRSIPLSYLFAKYEASYLSLAQRPETANLVLAEGNTFHLPGPLKITNYLVCLIQTNTRVYKRQSVVSQDGYVHKYLMGLDSPLVAWEPHGDDETD